MPAVPSSLLEPIWVEFAAAVGTDERAEFDPSHPLGCHRRRIPDRVVFEHLLVRVGARLGLRADRTGVCSDRMIRRRLAQRAQPGVAHVARRGPAWPILFVLPSRQREEQLQKHLVSAHVGVVATATMERLRASGAAEAVWRVPGLDHQTKSLIDLVR